MFRELMHKSPLLILPLGALVIFLGVFAAAVIYVFTRDKKQINAAAALPLDLDAPSETP